MQKLTEKQKKFCDLYIKLGNPAEAAVQAGYSKKTAKVIGRETLPSRIHRQAPHQARIRPCCRH
jgi:phage terminase small subunit